MYDFVQLCMTMYDYVWLCMTMYDYVWLCMTIYERESKSNFKNFFILSNYQNCLNNLSFFTRFKCSETFHTFLQTSTLFTFVYLWLPLFTFVYLCSTDASMHKFCACFLFFCMRSHFSPTYKLSIARWGQKRIFPWYLRGASESPIGATESDRP